MFKEMIQWSLNEYSDLPWRANRGLYRTLVSEFMLQQTTLGAVLKKFEPFLEQFPTLERLADATESEMRIAWKGLGYYRRAQNLLKAANAICDQHSGVIPRDLETLQSIPGVGPYTAGALRAIGHNLDAIALDANLERVLARFYGVKVEKGPKLQKELRAMFDRQDIRISGGDPRSWNEALMDLGRVFCQARAAHCGQCPLRESCHSGATANPTELPRTEKKVKESHELVLRRYVHIEDGQLLMVRKTSKQWLAGQLELPCYIEECTDPNLSQYPQLQKCRKNSNEPEFQIKSVITKYKIQNKIYREKPPRGSYEWVPMPFKSRDITSTDLKILSKLNLLEP